MNHLSSKLIGLFLGLGLGSTAIQAEIVGVAGSGAPVATPADLGIWGATSPFGQQCGVTEARGVLLTADLAVDGGRVIPAGTRVDSHLIFHNLVSGVPSYARVIWKFDGNVLGTMSDRTGILEANSSPFLAARGASYPASAFPTRGLEAETGDSATVRGTMVMVESTVNWQNDAGDWVRVVTESVLTDSDGDTVPDDLDDVVTSDTRAMLFVTAYNSGITNDLVLNAADGTPLQGVFLADLLDAMLEEARVAAVAEYEKKNAGKDRDAKHRAKGIYKLFLKFAKDELKEWEKVDLLSKDEAKVIEKILKDSPLYRVSSDTSDTIMVLGTDTGIANDLVLVGPDGSDIEDILLGTIVTNILDDAKAAAGADYKEFEKLVKEALEVWEKAHILSKDEVKIIEDILKDGAP